MFNFKYLLFFAVSLSILTACSKDDDNGGSASIIGTWEVESIQLTVAGETFDELEEIFEDCPGEGQGISTFNEDGTGIGEFRCDGELIETYNFEYELSSDRKKLSFTESGDTFNYNVDQLTSSRMVLSYEESFFGITSKVVETWVRR